MIEHLIRILGLCRWLPRNEEIHLRLRSIRLRRLRDARISH